MESLGALSYEEWSRFDADGTWGQITANLPIILGLVRKFISRNPDIISAPSLYSSDIDLGNEVLLRLHPLIQNDAYNHIPVRARIICIAKRILATLLSEFINVKKHRHIPPYKDPEGGESSGSPMEGLPSTQCDGCDGHGFDSASLKELMEIFARFRVLTTTQALIRRRERARKSWLS
jgi:hypothetical protein